MLLLEGMHWAEKRVLLVGKDGVGKEALKCRCAIGWYHDEPDYDTGMKDSIRKKIEMDGKPVLLEVFDLDLTDGGILNDNGHSSIASVHEQMARESSLVGVYSVDDRTSLAALAAFFAAPRKAPVMLMATKCDLHGSRQVTLQEGEKMAASLGCEVMEVSAKENVQVDEAFAAMARVAPDYICPSRTKKRGNKCAVS